MVLLAVGLAVAAATLLARPTAQLYQNTANIPLPQQQQPAAINLEWPPVPPYSNTVKELAAATLVECEAACIAYRNSAVSPVSGWTTCKSFTWVPGGSRCVAVLDASEWEPVASPGATAGTDVLRCALWSWQQRTFLSHGDHALRAREVARVAVVRTRMHSPWTVHVLTVRAM